MVPAPLEDLQMLASRNSMSRAVAATLVALPFALVACSSGETSASTVAVAEARTVAPEMKVDTPAVPEPVPPGAGVLATPAVTTPIESYNAGRYREAMVMYKELVDANAADAHSYYMLGLSSWKAGDFAGAREAFDKTITLDPHFVKGYFNQARVLLDLQRAPEALEMVGKGLAIDSSSADGWRLMARAQAAAGDDEGAMTTYRTLLVRDDSDVWGLNNLGVLLLDRGAFEEAMGPLSRAVQVRPTSPLFRNNLGMALERSGHMVAALRQYEEGVRHDSSFAKAVRNATRLTEAGVKSTGSEEVAVADLAERFRQVVKGWKDGMVSR